MITTNLILKYLTPKEISEIRVKASLVLQGKSSIATYVAELKSTLGINTREVLELTNYLKREL